MSISVEYGSVFLHWVPNESPSPYSDGLLSMLWNLLKKWNKQSISLCTILIPGCRYYDDHWSAKSESNKTVFFADVSQSFLFPLFIRMLGSVFATAGSVWWLDFRVSAQHTRGLWTRLLHWCLRSRGPEHDGMQHLRLEKTENCGPTTLSCYIVSKRYIACPKCGEFLCIFWCNQSLPSAPQDFGNPSRSASYFFFRSAVHQHQPNELPFWEAFFDPQGFVQGLGL